jgi:hypothetical protein
MQMVRVPIIGSPALRFREVDHLGLECPYFLGDKSHRRSGMPDRPVPEFQPQASNTGDQTQPGFRLARPERFHKSSPPTRIDRTGATSAHQEKLKLVPLMIVPQKRAPAEKLDIVRVRSVKLNSHVQAPFFGPWRDMLIGEVPRNKRALVAHMIWLRPKA